MLNITAAAIEQIKSINQGTTIRVRVMGGGCSGMQYGLSFDPNAIPEADKSFIQEGITIVADAKSYLFLEGATIDYEGGLTGSGFKVVSSKFKKTCGCGDSFSC